MIPLLVCRMCVQHTSNKTIDKTVETVADIAGESMGGVVKSTDHHVATSRVVPSEGVLLAR